MTEEMASGGMLSLPGAFLQGRELIAVFQLFNRSWPVQFLHNWYSQHLWWTACFPWGTVQLLIVLCPPLHLLSVVGDNCPCGGFGVGCLDDIWTEGFLHAFAQSMDVATVTTALNLMAQVKPLVVCTMSSILFASFHAAL